MLVFLQGFFFLFIKKRIWSCILQGGHKFLLVFRINGMHAFRLKVWGWCMFWSWIFGLSPYWSECVISSVPLIWNGTILVFMKAILNCVDSLVFTMLVELSLFERLNIGLDFADIKYFISNCCNFLTFCTWHNRY